MKKLIQLNLVLFKKIQPLLLQLMSVSAVTKEIEQHLRQVQIFEAAVRTCFSK